MAIIKVRGNLLRRNITEGNLINNIRNNIEYIAHFHAAGNPGRHELNNGEINYKQVSASIDALNYDGFIGLEYFPKNNPIESLKDLILGSESS